MVLEYLQKYESIEKQKMTKEIMHMHNTIKGIQVSYGLSAGLLIAKGLSTIIGFRRLSGFRNKRMFAASVGLGVIGSNAFCFHL